MRSRALLVLPLFVAALLALRQGILWLDAHLDIRGDQTAVIVSRGIDPAALFYTQVDLALRAEKSVRSSIARAQEAPAPADY